MNNVLRLVSRVPVLTFEPAWMASMVGGIFGGVLGLTGTAGHPAGAALVGLLAVLGLWGLWSCMAYGFPELRRLGGYPGECNDGDWVAEVWLTWFFGRGTTLFRRRFNSMPAAAAAVKRQAAFLDSVLPRKYVCTDRLGHRYFEEHEYGIHYGVRTWDNVSEDDRFQVETYCLPGS